MIGQTEPSKTYSMMHSPIQSLL